MNNNKLILKHCPNFYKIINFEYFDDDDLSEKLINVYEDYIFKVDLKDSAELRVIEQLDEALFKYINDYMFRKELKSEMKRIKIRKNDDPMKSIINWIIKVYDNYEIGYTRNIYFSRWI